jgi:CubicO group peptidase (beta-lactamase class C family)
MTSRRQFVLSGAAMTVSAGCAGTGPSPSSQPGIVNVPGARPSDWETAAPDSQGITAAAMSDVLEAGAQVRGLRSLLVVRNGVLIGERYYAGASASDVLAINSVTKSVCSMLVGQALQRRALPGLGAPVRSLIPEALAQVPGSAAADVMLEQILTGRSGVAFDWQTHTGALMSAPDPVRFVLGLPADPATPPGWTYNDAAVCLVAPILAHAQGMDLASLAARDLFAPLGIQRFWWLRDRMGNAFSFGGLGLRTRDLMKLAWVMLDGGKWQGASVLPPVWISESTRPRGPASWKVAPVSNIGYGYLWFTGTLHGKQIALGWRYGGQFALLVPELKLAVATAGDFAAHRRAEKPDGCGHGSGCTRRATRDLSATGRAQSSSELARLAS